jgi:hypothetical protein
LKLYQEVCTTLLKIGLTLFYFKSRLTSIRRNIMASDQVLAIESGAHAEKTGWRRNQDLIDALPYVDGLTPQEKQAVDALIEEEVRTMYQSESIAMHPTTRRVPVSFHVFSSLQLCRCRRLADAPQHQAAG